MLTALFLDLEHVTDRLLVFIAVIDRIWIKTQDLHAPVLVPEMNLT